MNVVLTALLVSGVVATGVGCQPPPTKPPVEADAIEESKATPPTPEEDLKPTGASQSETKSAEQQGTADAQAANGSSSEGGGQGAENSVDDKGSSAPTEEAPTSGSGSSKTRTESGNPKYPRAADAAKHAASQLRKGQAMEPSGASMQVLLDGWRAASEHPTDSACSSLASKLVAELQRHEGAATGGENARPFDDMPLKIR